MDNKYLDLEKKPATTADIITLLGGFIGAIKVLLAAPPFNYELAQASADGVLNLIGFILIGLAMYRNNRRYVPKNNPPQQF